MLPGEEASFLIFFRLRVGIVWSNTPPEPNFLALHIYICIYLFISEINECVLSVFTGLYIYHTCYYFIALVKLFQMYIYYHVFCYNWICRKLVQLSIYLSIYLFFLFFFFLKKKVIYLLLLLYFANLDSRGGRFQTSGIDVYIGFLSNYHIDFRILFHPIKFR